MARRKDNINRRGQIEGTEVNLLKSSIRNNSTSFFNLREL
jgi:hypothetical protein